MITRKIRDDISYSEPYLERFVATVCQHMPLQPTLTC